MFVQFHTAVSARKELPGFPLQRGEKESRKQKALQSKEPSWAITHRRNIK